MKTRAQKLGFVTKAVYSVEGNVYDVASKLSKHVPRSKNFCLVFGGEPTVTVKGKGKGGRNQELVLHLLKKLKDRDKKIIHGSLQELTEWMEIHVLQVQLQIVACQQSPSANI
ncbi:MOFRL family protein [Candidatus Nitrosotalea sp. TS]|uniref:MOFRL family protein n=1 Tax=Candidatus Nitrosotalea sp. TS TaxID=2341020 RepID=UPI0021028E7F|nr:MOFRL family protein [Candidatus Nitrosotalea sp. TS]